ncbi:MAG: DUF378 domain-containing protein [Bdellovibrionales bacterium GWB1_55_8]|nr:MAG: DUF378 domain-containing protein [Bdellovibrionales bacterium GWB1_55_8]
MVRFATALLIIGGLNWGLIGLFQFDLVAAIFGGQAAILSRIIYTLVGAAALYEVFVFNRLRSAEIPASRRVDRIDRAA